MKKSVLSLVGLGAVALAGVALAVIVVPHDRHAPPGTPGASTPAAKASVAANGFVLASASIGLPDDTGTFPDGPHADVVNANCTACHSASMVMQQPALSADAWKAEVTKMRDVYKAPVPESAVADIVAYLAGLAVPPPAMQQSRTANPSKAVEHDEVRR